MGCTIFEDQDTRSVQTVQFSIGIKAQYRPTQRILGQKGDMQLYRVTAHASDDSHPRARETQKETKERTFEKRNRLTRRTMGHANGPLFY